ncbi:MAG TPA: glycine zipper 2TM domain-containing protein [Burkholderiaceae bacterium]|nr:glycine zipper 2TM domain-containing protein [Burkholderiaceae bacterium]
MNLRRHLTQIAVSSVVTLAVCTTAVASERRTANTVLGAGLGAVAGAVLSDGDPLLTLGGAAAGGLLGNVLTEDRRHYHGRYDGAHRRRVEERYGYHHERRRGYDRGWRRSHRGH